MKRILIALSIALLAVSCGNNAAKVTDVNKVQSPDGKLELTFQLTESGTPQYALTYEGQDVILPSDLGFELRGVLKAQKLVYEKDGSISKKDRAESYSFATDFVVDSVATAAFD
jgi:hypothetical protein